MNNKSDNIISVIVPVYNVEKYLKKCIDSILENTYKKIELILVDDGSTDKSGVICDEYKRKTDKIKVIHKDNGGLSSARNAGLQISRGEFVIFIDSDDYVSNRALELLIGTMEKYGADLVQGNYCKVSENNKVIYVNKLSFELLNNLKDIRDAYFIDEKISVMACGKLYRRKQIYDKPMVEGKINEDVMFLSDILASLNKVVILPDIMYFYRQRKESIMHAEFTPRKFDSFFAYEYAMKNYKREMPEYIIYIKRLICLNCFYMYDLAKRSHVDQKYIVYILRYFNKYKKEVFKSYKKYPGNKKILVRLYMFNLNKNITIMCYRLVIKTKNSIGSVLNEKNIFCNRNYE